MKYRVTNQHSITRTVKTEGGEKVSFAPGETKIIETEPPRNQGLWRVEVLEQTVKPEDTELKEVN